MKLWFAYYYYYYSNFNHGRRQKFRSPRHSCHGPLCQFNQALLLMEKQKKGFKTEADPKKVA